MIEKSLDFDRLGRRSPHFRAELRTYDEISSVRSALSLSFHFGLLRYSQAKYRSPSNSPRGPG